jgi:hypothetical protein
MRPISCTVDPHLWGPVTPNLSVLVGSLPTLVGQVEHVPEHDHHRRALSNQQPAIQPRNVQVNFSDGPFNATLSLNDGFYSSTYNWVSGLITYVISRPAPLPLWGRQPVGHGRILLPRR